MSWNSELSPLSASCSGRSARLLVALDSRDPGGGCSPATADPRFRTDSGRRACGGRARRYALRTAACSRSSHRHSGRPPCFPGLIVDVDAVVSRCLHAITRQSDQPLDVVDGRIGRIAEHDHIAALRLADRQELGVGHRQTQSVRELVDQDEITILQRRHHRIGRNAKWLEQKRAQQQHDHHDGNHAAGIIDDAGFGASRWAAGRAPPPRGRASAAAASDRAPRSRRPRQDTITSTSAEIEPFRTQQLDRPAISEYGQHGIDQPQRPRDPGRPPAARPARRLGRRNQSSTKVIAATGSSSQDSRQASGRTPHPPRYLRTSNSSELIQHYFRPTCRTARNASCGISTEPTCFMRFLPSFCFSSSLRLRRQVAAVALGQHVLAQRLHGGARDDVRADGRLHGHFEHLARNQFLHLVDQLAAALIGVVAVHDDRQRIDRVAIDQDVELAQAAPLWKWLNS